MGTEGPILDQIPPGRGGLWPGQDGPLGPLGARLRTIDPLGRTEVTSCDTVDLLIERLISGYYLRIRPRATITRISVRKVGPGSGRGESLGGGTDTQSQVGGRVAPEPGRGDRTDVGWGTGTPQDPTQTPGSIWAPLFSYETGEEGPDPPVVSSLGRRLRRGGPVLLGPSMVLLHGGRVFRGE